ncbi:MAG: recombinase family protein [Pseudomonadota bacterium]|nr:recombinase family protein [Pseudomonadota bacterium]
MIVISLDQRIEKDVVVVYKIDRLTRSLTDFSRIVEVFDQAGASFVSVTQQFNTTTSMGRLTLNVLLSFAQFEREVTAERIRDKIAASKKKGMWMGGVVPLGYRVENRKLLVHPEEASTVRWLFERYLQIRSVRALVDEAAAHGHAGGTTVRKDGSTAVTHPFGRGNLYHLLSNVIYAGSIRHKDKIYDGEHPPIIDRQTFDDVQRLPKDQTPARKNPSNQQDGHLLTGILYDEAGEKLRAVHANKKGVRYRYYVSGKLVEGRKNVDDGWRLPAKEVDSAVEHRLIHILQDHPQLTGWIRRFCPTASLGAAIERSILLISILQHNAGHTRRELVRKLVRRVLLKRGSLTIEVGASAIVTELLPDLAVPEPNQSDAIVGIECPITFKRRGVEVRMVVTNAADQHRQPDGGLVQLVLRVHRYHATINDGGGKTLSNIANAEGVELSEVSRVLPLDFLSPSIVDSILAGTQPVSLTAQRLSRLADLPASWRQQSELLNPRLAASTCHPGDAPAQTFGNKPGQQRRTGQSASPPPKSPLFIQTLDEISAQATENAALSSEGERGLEILSLNGGPGGSLHP